MQYYLGGIGKFKFEELSNGNKHIRFVVLDREDICFKIKPYFSLLYGEKRVAFNKIDRIYDLIKNPTLYNHKDLVSELIHLVSNLNIEGQQMKLPLAEKLAAFNIKKII